MIIGSLYSSGIVHIATEVRRRDGSTRYEPACGSMRSGAVALQGIREGTLEDVTCTRCQGTAQHALSRFRQ